ncbi:MAG: flagellar FliJ family protein [Caldimicrobium sp.]
MKKKLDLFKRILWFKELLEERSKVRVYNAKINYQKLLEEKKLIEEEYKDCLSYLQEKRRFSAQDLRNWLSYLNTLLEFREIADNKVKMQEKILEELKEELKKRNIEKRVMERFTEKITLQYNLSKWKKEIKELDEIILLRKGRNLEESL